MIIDNSSYVIRYRKLMYLTTISLTIFIPIFLLVDFFDKPTLGVSKELYVIAMAVLYVLFHIYRFMLNPYFIQFSDENNKLMFRCLN